MWKFRLIRGNDLLETSDSYGYLYNKMQFGDSLQAWRLVGAEWKLEAVLPYGEVAP